MVEAIPWKTHKMPMFIEVRHLAQICHGIKLTQQIERSQRVCSAHRNISGIEKKLIKRNQ